MKVIEMRRLYPLLMFVFACVFFCGPVAVAGQAKPTASDGALSVNQQSPEEILEMLASLVELQSNLKKQLALTREKIKKSASDAEKERLEGELARLDRQLSDASRDFERIATGVEAGIFGEKKSEDFSWKSEITTLVEPAIKEIKRLTVRARLKTQLMDTIAELSGMRLTAANAVRQLEHLSKVGEDRGIKNQVKELLPAWRNTENRIRNKLELAQFELSQMRDQEISFVENFSQSILNFLRVRGRYLLVAVIAFGCIILVGRLLHRAAFRILPGVKLEKRPFHIRLLDLSLRVLTVAAGIFGLFFVLYQAEDWFLLSMAIIFFISLSWTVRQTVPRLWQQGRLMLNIGSVREGERLQLHGIPWKVETIRVFCLLYNPTLEVRLRLPIEHIVGMVSRPYSPEEPWFPCKKGDWVVVGDRPRAKVVGLSHELVETVERGGKRYCYRTEDFLGQSPVNLSRNFRLRVDFGIGYDLQDQATTTIPALLKRFIEGKLEEEGYADSCFNLQVEFKQAGASSLDLAVLADFKGEQAGIYSRLERAIQRWCVDAATLHDWQIPFPQLTVNWPVKDRILAERMPSQSGQGVRSLVS